MNINNVLERAIIFVIKIVKANKYYIIINNEKIHYIQQFQQLFFSKNIRRFYLGNFDIKYVPYLECHLPKM